MRMLQMLVMPLLVSSLVTGMIFLLKWSEGLAFLPIVLPCELYC